MGGKEPNVKVLNSTESILYFAAFSSIIGFAISFAVLHIAFKQNRHISSNKKKLQKRDSRACNSIIPYLDKATTIVRTYSANQPSKQLRKQVIG